MKESAVIEAGGNEPPVDEGARVLVLEGDPDARSTIQEGLTSLGFSVTCAADIQEGVRLALENPYDVVVSDLRSSGRPGLDFCRRAAAGPGSPRGLLLGTGDDSPGMKEPGDFGTCFIPRPFSLRDLAQTVHLMAMERRHGYKGLLRVERK